MITINKTHSGRRKRAGFSLLEVMFAAAVLAIAISGASSAMVSAMRLDRVNRETTVAVLEARSVLEQAQSLELADIYTEYNQSTLDDGGPVAGPTFNVASLTPDPADADGIVGQVFFPEQFNGLSWELREDFVDAGLGMPMDLNGDGVIDNLDHSGDFVILPVRMQVQWAGVSGPRTVNLVTILSRR